MADQKRKRYLNGVERSMEVLFGLIMVLTFTGSLSVINAGHTEVREMLIGALGCNLAWGIIDAIIYLMNAIAERGRGLRRLRLLKASDDVDVLNQVMQEALPGVVFEVFSQAERKALRDRIVQLPEPPRHYARLNGADLLGALGVFLLVFGSTFPVALPFLFITEPWTALRVSNAIAIVLLFLVGHQFALYSGFRPWRTGLLLVMLGLTLVGIAIPLGG